MQTVRLEKVVILDKQPDHESKANPYLNHFYFNNWMQAKRHAMHFVDNNPNKEYKSSNANNHESMEFKVDDLINIHHIPDLTDCTKSIHFRVNGEDMFVEVVEVNYDENGKMQFKVAVHFYSEPFDLHHIVGNKLMLSNVGSNDIFFVELTDDLKLLNIEPNPTNNSSL